VDMNSDDGIFMTSGMMVPKISSDTNSDNISINTLSALASLGFSTVILPYSSTLGIENGPEGSSILFSSYSMVKVGDLTREIPLIPLLFELSTRPALKGERKRINTNAISNEVFFNKFLPGLIWNRVIEKSSLILREHQSPFGLTVFPSTINTTVLSSALVLCFTPLGTVYP